MKQNYYYIILLVILLLTNKTIKAQIYDKTYINDFSMENVDIFNDVGLSQNIVYNKQLILTTGQQSFGTATISKPLNSECFKISTVVSQQSGEIFHGFGIFFSGTSIQNCNLFLISSSKYFSVANYENGVFRFIKNWQYSDYILPNGEDNYLEIISLGNECKFLINGHIVSVIKSMKYYGDNFGYYLKSPLKIASQRFVLETQGMKYVFDKSKKVVSKITSDAAEIAPIESDDGSCLYFSRISHPSNVGDIDDCDIWFSEKDSGAFTSPQHFVYPINNDLINAVIKTTNNNTIVYIEGTYTENGEALSSNGISKTTRISDRVWSHPTSIKIQDFYNNNKHGTYTFSSDMKVLVMALERKDTYGKLDLYVSFRNPDGSYSAPKNMGNVINTTSDDGTPFIAADNKTLYFSSYGHGGYGNSDIFVARRLDNSWTRWSTPDNLGPKVNSRNWDAYFSVAADGNSAYFVSNSNEDFLETIYKIELPLNLRTVSDDNAFEGKVVNSLTKKPIKAEIWYSYGNEMFNISTSNDGIFSFSLNENQSFSISIKAKGYWPSKLTFPYTTTRKVRVEMIPLKKGSVISLENLEFAPQSSNLHPNSYNELERLREMMEENPNMKILVRGYAIPTGDAKQLQELSEGRAIKVKNYLTDHGISSYRIRTLGYSGLNNEKGKTNTSKGRCVEFSVLEN